METLSIVTLSRPETTGLVTRGAARLMTDLGYAPLLEVGLPNGRRADVMALGPRGEIAICEVKSGPEDYLTDRRRRLWRGGPALRAAHAPGRGAAQGADPGLRAPGSGPSRLGKLGPQKRW
jgi:hypothetical protein